MGIALLKKMNTVLPDSMKTAAGPLIRGKLIYNNVFRNQYAVLDKYGTFSCAEQEKIQIETLKATLIHAYEHTAFYHTMFDRVGFNPYDFSSFDEMEKLPIITKADVSAHYDEMQADDISDYYHATTGGSTGEPLNILLDRQSIYKEKAFIYHYWKKAGYDYKKSKIITFRGLEFHGKYSKANPLYNEIVMNPFLLNKKTITIYIKKIERFGAEFIHGYPSAIFAFCKLAEEKSINLKGLFKAAFFISENVFDYQKNYIERILDCNSYAFYGHSERAVFAEQIGGGYSFNKLYGYVELSEINNG